MSKSWFDPYTLETIYRDGSRISGIEMHNRRVIYESWWKPLAVVYGYLAKKHTVWGYFIKYGVKIPVTVDLTAKEDSKKLHEALHP